MRGETIEGEWIDGDMKIENIWCNAQEAETIFSILCEKNTYSIPSINSLSTSPLHSPPSYLLLVRSNTVLTEPTDPGEGEMSRKIEDAAAGLFEQMETEDITPTCASLALQILLLEIIDEASKEVNKMSKVWSESSQGDELRDHLDEFDGLLSRVLEETLEISNPLLQAESTQVRTYVTLQCSTVLVQF